MDQRLHMMCIQLQYNTHSSSKSRPLYCKFWSVAAKLLLIGCKRFFKFFRSDSWLVNPGMSVLEPNWFRFCQKFKGCETKYPFAVHVLVCNMWMTIGCINKQCVSCMYSVPEILYIVVNFWVIIMEVESSEQKILEVKKKC